MFFKFFLSACAVFLLTVSAWGQGAPPPVTSAASSVAGLELPADMKVSPDEGFVNIQAKCKGDVRWLVVSQVKVKYVSIPQSNSIIVSVPPAGGVVSVFAVGLVDGKMTEFARTNVTVGGTPLPPPNPDPNPNPNPIVTGKLHVTFLVDVNGMTPDLAKLINSQSLRTGLNQRGHWFRLYDLRSPVVAQKKLDQVVARVGGNAVMVVQSDDGRVLVAQAMPRTEQEVLNIIGQITGKQSTTF